MSITFFSNIFALKLYENRQSKDILNQVTRLLIQFLLILNSCEALKNAKTYIWQNFPDYLA
ncbi:hypothetical protein CDG77_19790 [Nostoc sp. 'Peltigera membranacea cyanobiont' 213]|nr:hypothetical protein CDG77_19790 [Nostoc sp. 'Peltigera membranacea cyanobiont' 213]